MQAPGHDPGEGTATSTAVQFGGGNSSGAKEGASNITHTQAPRDIRAHPNHPTTLRSFAQCMDCMAAHQLMPSAMAFVSYGFVLDQVQVQELMDYQRPQGLRSRNILE